MAALAGRSVKSHLRDRETGLLAHVFLRWCSTCIIALLLKIGFQELILPAVFTPPPDLEINL